MTAPQHCVRTAGRVKSPTDRIEAGAGDPLVPPSSGRRSSSESQDVSPPPRPAQSQHSHSTLPWAARCQSGRHRNTQHTAGKTLAQGCAPVKNAPFNAPTANVEACRLLHAPALHPPVHDKTPSPAPGWAVDTHVGCTTDGYALGSVFKGYVFPCHKPHH